MLGCVLLLLIHPADGKITTKEQTSPPVRTDRDGIYILNERNFNSFLSSSISKEQRQGLFVKFYAPWCGHCKELEHPWMGIATAVKLYQSSLDELEIKSINKVSVASFDCDTGPQATKFCKEDLSITGFPTIMYFEGNEYKKFYVGTRGFEDLSIFVERESGLSFPYLNGFRRWKATGFRMLCELMQFSMESNGEDGGKPSGKALVMFGVFVTIPAVVVLGLLTGIAYCCCCQSGSELIPSENMKMVEENNDIFNKKCCNVEEDEEKEKEEKEEKEEEKEEEEKCQGTTHKKRSRATTNKTKQTKQKQKVGITSSVNTSFAFMEDAIVPPTIRTRLPCGIIDLFFLFLLLLLLSSSL